MQLGVLQMRKMHIFSTAITVEFSLLVSNVVILHTIDACCFRVFLYLFVCFFVFWGNVSSYTNLVGLMCLGLDNVCQNFLLPLIQCRINEKKKKKTCSDLSSIKHHVVPETMSHLLLIICRSRCQQLHRNCFDRRNSSCKTQQNCKHWKNPNPC